MQELSRTIWKSRKQTTVVILNVQYNIQTSDIHLFKGTLGRSGYSLVNPIDLFRTSDAFINYGECFALDRCPDPLILLVYELHSIILNFRELSLPVKHIARGLAVHMEGLKAMRLGFLHKRGDYLWAGFI